MRVFENAKNILTILVIYEYNVLKGDILYYGKGGLIMFVDWMERVPLEGKNR